MTATTQIMQMRMSIQTDLQSTL